jgi:glycerophosphoryl diester phosphodiesterase
VSPICVLVLTSTLTAATVAVHAAGAAPSVDARPLHLVSTMKDGPLKSRLAACAGKPLRRSNFSIGHRGAPLHYPEHTREGYVAAAAMGAGVIECDVTFTKDKQLVCRHAQNDLHTSTDILLTPLASRCFVPFRPATIDEHGKLLEPAIAECRTSDITLAEFRTLQGKRDQFDPHAKTVAEYVRGADTTQGHDHSYPTRGTLMTHAESIALFKKLGVGMAPELKSPVVTMPFDGLSQRDYAQRMIDEYKAAGVRPERVWPQSFNRDDVLYWLEKESQFGRQAVYLDDAETTRDLPDAKSLQELNAQGVRYWAPPLFALLSLDSRGSIVPSRAALDARAAGLQLVAWTVERSGTLGTGTNGWYYQTVDSAIQREGDVFEVLHVLSSQAHVRAVFSDWPATTTYYANCVGLD